MTGFLRPLSRFARRLHLDKVAELFRGLSADEQNQLHQLVTKLEGLLAARGFGPGGGCAPGDAEPC